MLTDKIYASLYATLDKQQTINKVLKNFNFEKVHKVMQALNWKWVSSNTDNKIPSISELVILANEMLGTVWDNVKQHESKQSSLATGGFLATANKYTDGEILLDLKFVLTEFNYSNKDTCY